MLAFYELNILSERCCGGALTCSGEFVVDIKIYEAKCNEILEQNLHKH